MALFFDQEWFDQRLAELGRAHDDVAKLLNISLREVAEIWKDQRELQPHEVSALAQLLEAAPAEIADHAGVATPIPEESAGDVDMGLLLQRFDELSGRLQRVERVVADLKALILDLRQEGK